MTLQNQYLMVGQSAKNRLFGIAPFRRTISRRTMNSMAANNNRNASPMQMLISRKFNMSNSRLAVIIVGFITLAVGIILSSIPWLDYIIMKQLRIINGTLSYHYWHKPGVLRLTKVFIFNMTNPDGFLNNGEKPRLMEIGPFIYKESMEKVNVQFYDNGTVSFQHNKVLQFVPHMSVPDAETLKLVVPNIPLLTLTTQANSLNVVLRKGISLFLKMTGMQPFKTVTIKEFIFGYDDTLTSLANQYFPEGKRPPKKMGLFLLRNGTLTDKASIFTGVDGMSNFGYMDRLNGLDHLPYWDGECSSIQASEGSFFPPREQTKSDLVYLFDKDLCRSWPLKYREMAKKDGIDVGIYTPAEHMFDPSDPDYETCYCTSDEGCPVKGVQSISPCQFGAPIYISLPHFYNGDQSLLDAVEGLNPNKEKHETFLKIQPRLGVPLEARARVQINLKVEQSSIAAVRQFPSIMYPVMWLEEGVDELPPHLIRWIFMATTFADKYCPIITYGVIVLGILVLIFVFVRTYQNMVFTVENLERGKRTLKRGSSFIVNGQHKLMVMRESYSLLNNPIAETTDGGSS